MSLSCLIKKGGLAEIATATMATAATSVESPVAKVAKVADVAVAPQPDIIKHHGTNADSITSEETQQIRSWLQQIGESDPEIIKHTLDVCKVEPSAREYILSEANKTQLSSGRMDDRRFCKQCANLTPRGLCLAAYRSEIEAARNYCPADDAPRRCEGFRSSG